jgi:zinc protease
VGHVGVRRNTPDYFSLLVVNGALGGQVSSRINLNLREDKGYTYGAQSRFDYGRKLGSFFVATAVRADVTGPAIHEIIAELRRAESAPLAAAELNQARGALTQSLPAEFETNTATSSSFSELFAYGLPLDYYRRLPAQFSSVKATTAEALAHRYFDPASMVIVVVGDRAKLEAALNKLDLGPIEVWPIAGTLF